MTRKTRFVAMLLALALVMLSPLAALAEIVCESFKLDGGYASLNKASNTLIMYKNGNYALYDNQGQKLSADYKDMTSRHGGRLIEVNGSGIIDAQGNVIVEPIYNDVKLVVPTYFDERTENNYWVLGIYYELTSDTNGDYYNSKGEQFNVTSVDVYFQSNKIATLSRAEYVNSYLMTNGKYLAVKINANQGFYLSSTGERVDFTGDYFYTGEYQDVYKKGVLHNATQQYAFVPGCTLDEDDVFQTVWYDSNGNFIDLQGNVISQGPSAYKEYDSASYYGGDYLRFRANSKYGLVNLQGEEVLPALYDSLGGTSGAFYAQGYQAVLQEGRLSWLDLTGNVTASFSYSLSESDYKGFYNNAVFACVKNMGAYMVLTATAGQLPEMYEDVVTPGAYHRILCVKKNGLWGAIDMDGNTVLPFKHTSIPEISADSTVIYAQDENRQKLVYTLTYIDEQPVVEPAPVVNPAPAAPAANGWICPTCAKECTGKFCSECGTAKPVVQVCQTCGYTPAAGKTPKFCPECGTKF